MAAMALTYCLNLAQGKLSVPYIVVVKWDAEQ